MSGKFDGAPYNGGYPYDNEPPEQLPICQHEGCNEVANEYVIEGYENPPHFFFCDDHAAEFGFCVHCGAFIGGTEDVFRTGQTGMCFDCYVQLERELMSNEDDVYDDDEAWDGEL